MRSPDVVRETPASVPLKHVAAVFVGNGLEFYDFLSYAIFAVYIGKAYFPAGSSGTSLLLSEAVFGLGFVARPLGGIVLGTLGDRIGRKPAMLISFAMMGLGMLGVALTPTYAEIGIAAPLLLLCYRLVQGFALGGEVGPTTAYMIEAAPPLRRGLYGSMQYTTQDASTLVAAGIGVALTAILTEAQLASWGWRVVFLLGVLIVPFGIMIRRGLPETLHAADDAALAPDAAGGGLSYPSRLRPHLRVLGAGLVLLATTTIGAYTINYMTSYALDTLHMGARVALGVTVITSGAAVLFEPVSGLLSDRYGRKPVMLGGGIATGLVVLPSFWAVVHYPSTLLFYGTMFAIGVFFALYTPPIIIALTESLPRRIRSGAVAMVYAFAISIFGGSTQVILTWLTHSTGNPLAPALYWSVAIGIGIVATWMLPESAPCRTGKLTLD
jgi:MFS transporter, MHS family, citrate/tricarballylate:H+ symporter